MNVVINNKPVNMNSLEFDDIFKWDAPDFCDAYVDYAEFEDGTELTEDEIELMEDKFYSEVREALYNSLI